MINQMKSGVILNYAIFGLNALVGIVYTPFMLNMLGKNEFGIYSLAGSIVAYLSILDLGFGNAVIRYTSKFRAQGLVLKQYEMFGMFTILYSGIALITVAAGLVLYSYIDVFFHATMTLSEIERTKIILLLLIFNLAITFPLSIYGAIITAYEFFVFPRVVQIIRIILNTITMVCLLYLGYKAIAMVIVQTAFNLMALLANVFYCKYKLKIKVIFKHIDVSLLKKISVYSFWIFISIIVDRIYWNTGQFILGAFTGPATIAVFSLAVYMQSIYMGFSTTISGVFLPKITAIVTKGDSEQTISDLFIKIGRIQYIILAYVLSLFILFGRDFIIFWAGNDYKDTYLIALIFFASLTVPLVQTVAVTILQARNRMKFRSLLYLAIAAFSLVFQIIATMKFGVLGCAATIALTLLIGQGLVMNIYYWKTQHLDILAFWKEIARMSIIPTLLTFSWFFVLNIYPINNIFTMCLQMTVFSICYIPMFLLFAMNDYERHLFLTPISNVTKKLFHA